MTIDSGIEIGCDDRRAEVAQEQEDDEEGEDRAEQALAHHVPDAFVDLDRGVVGDGEAHVAGQQRTLRSSAA